MENWDGASSVLDSRMGLGDMHGMKVPKAQMTVLAAITWREI